MNRSSLPRPNPPRVSPRETAPNGLRRWRKKLRLGLRPFLPAGPRRFRCCVCCRALTRRTIYALEGPALVQGPAGELVARLGAICCSHLIYRGHPCRCGFVYYVIPGPTLQRGALVEEAIYLSPQGETIHVCPACWAPLSPGPCDVARRCRWCQATEERICP